MNGDPGSTWPLTRQIILVIILTLINAVFAAAEIAFVSLNQTTINELEKEGDRKAIRVNKLLAHSTAFLDSLQVVITLAGFINSAFAAYYLSDFIFPYLGDLSGAQPIAILLTTFLISYIVLVLGELYPKQLATQMPERIALNTSGIIMFMQKLLTPFTLLLTGSTLLLKKITPVDFDAEKKSMTRDEFRFYLEQSRQNEVIDIAEFSMLKGVLSLDHKIAREIMVPRTDTVMIDYADGNEENMDMLLNIPYSRIPMYFEDKDNVMGIIHVKNILKASKDKPLREIDLKEITNEPLFVPESIYIDDLLYELKRTQNHI